MTLVAAIDKSMFRLIAIVIQYHFRLAQIRMHNPVLMCLDSLHLRLYTSSAL